MSALVPPHALTFCVAAAIIAMLFARPTGRWSGRGAIFGFLLLLSLGGVFAFTLSPGPVPPGQCAGFAPHWWESLWTVSDVSANVALGIPLGVCVASIRPPLRAGMAFFCALAVPLLVEGIQLVAPIGRACQTSDIVANMVGVTGGAAAALVACVLLSLGRKRRDVLSGRDT